MWKWIVLVAAILLAVIAYGYIQDQWLSTHLEELKTDKEAVVKNQDAWIRTCEDEISRMATERDQVRKEKEAERQGKLAALAEAEKQKEVNDEIKARLDRIRVSDDPALLIRDLQSRGLLIRRLGSN